MDILDELKRLGPQTEDKPETTASANSDMAGYNRSAMETAILDVHNYLRELVSGLNKMATPISADFVLPEVGTIQQVPQHNYELALSNNANTDVLSLSYILNPADRVSFQISPDLDKQLLEKMNQSGISFSLNSKEGRLDIDDEIPVKLIFTTHPEEHYILLTIHNYDKPGRQRYALTTNLLDDYLKNQLGLFILRRENNLILQLQDFLKTSSDSLPQLDGDITETDMNTTEMDVSRLKSLFSKEAKLYLTYQNTIKEVSSKHKNFILGRSRQCDMKIDSDLASRQHAQILYRKGKFVLIDKSTNGSFAKPQGGKEVYVQGEEFPLSGSGFISLGKSVTVDNEHVIYYSCQ